MMSYRTHSFTFTKCVRAFNRAIIILAGIAQILFGSTVKAEITAKQGDEVRFANSENAKIVIISDKPRGLNSLLVEYKGQFTVADTNWGTRYHVKDLNLDGNEEVMFESHSGGSCCPPLVGIAFLNKSLDQIETFEFNKWTTWSGWDDVHIKIDKGGSELSGFMNTYHPETQEQNKTICITYIFSGERPRIKHFLVPDNQDKAGSGGLFACDDPVLWK
jgi:hypothetical protein